MISNKLNTILKYRKLKKEYKELKKEYQDLKDKHSSLIMKYSRLESLKDKDKKITYIKGLESTLEHQYQIKYRLREENKELIEKVEDLEKKLKRCSNEKKGFKNKIRRIFRKRKAGREE